MNETVIVRDSGFANEDFSGAFVPFGGTVPANAEALDLGPDANTGDLAPHLDQLRAVRIAFPSFADGRGFTLARRLRMMGYTGRLRAKGHVLADQYAMARRAGFDEVEISPDLAARQPEPQWLARADWQAGDYQHRLRG